MAIMTTNNTLDFRDPGPMDERLLNVPGFINELTLHMCDMINEERLDARKYVFTLKNAA